MNGLDLQEKLSELFPLHTAETWDNVGLQIGTMKKDISTVLICLDVTLEVIEEAIKQKATLIISHHPIIFKAISTINSDQYLGKIIERLLIHNISLYVIHTNFDVASNGMNALLSNRLGLENISVLEDQSEQGIGVIGTIPTTTVDKYIPVVKKAFEIPSLKLIGNEKDEISRVAIVGGSGSSYLYLAKQRSADLYITGDVTYHKALDAKAIGLTVFDVGHHVEEVFKQGLVDILNKCAFDVKVIASKVNTNPYQDK